LRAPAQRFTLRLLSGTQLREEVVEQFTERRIGRLTVRIDRLLCVGFGDCIEVAPQVFEFDDEGIVTFRPEIPEFEDDRVIQACDICPVDALSVFDEDNNQLV
jgi:ferredoxin